MWASLNASILRNLLFRASLNFVFYALFGRFLNFEEYSKLPNLKKSQVWEHGKRLKKQKFSN